ncbi:hypothetical protein VTO73DRAFT_14443 [Trametes versicolor]
MALRLSQSLSWLLLNVEIAVRHLHMIILASHYPIRIAFGIDTIVGFEDSVNCLQFNETADLLAIGCDDGRFRILEIEDGALVLKFRIVNVAVTSLLWHPEEVNTIFVGYSDGGIVQCVVDPMDRQALPNVTPVPAGLSDPVEALDYSSHTSTLAAIIGSNVVCLTLSDNGLWISRIMPCPPSDNSLPYAEDNLPRSLHFSQQGRALVVAYLYHGIIGWDVATKTCLWSIPPDTRIARSALSADEKKMVICNLFDGFACYNLETREKDGFGPPQRKKRSLNRRRFSYKSLYVGEDSVGPSHGQPRRMSDEAVTSTIIQSVLSDSRSDEPDVPMVSTPAHGTPLPVSSLSLTDKAAAVTTLEPCVPTQQSTTTHTRGVQTADHLDSALSNFTPSPPPENCVLPSATRTQRFQRLPSASNMSGSVGALVQASWDSPTSSPPSSSYSAASSPGREEIPPNRYHEWVFIFSVVHVAQSFFTACHPTSFPAFIQFGSIG